MNFLYYLVFLVIILPPEVILLKIDNIFLLYYLEIVWRLASTLLDIIKNYIYYTQ